MSDSEAATVRVDRASLDRLRQAVVQQHGQLRGHLRDAASNALADYADGLEEKREDADR